MTVLIAISLIILLLLVLVSILPNEAKQEDSKVTHRANAIERFLPQTQCGDCGFHGCRPYAESIAKGASDINRCLPGGLKTVHTLANLLGKQERPLYKNTGKYNLAKVALIDEAICIGCVKCIRACPVDAIIGAPKQMHSIIDVYCTGCELCIAPCPVDCISMVAH